MSLTLGDEDRRAVDMLLDQSGIRANGNGNGGTHTAAPAKDGQFHQRIQRVEQILSLLSNMPAGDPPTGDLVKRTLQRIEEAEAAARTGAPVQPPASVDGDRPIVH